MKKLFIYLFFFCFIIPNVYAEENKITVGLSKCVDGDTAKFIINEKEVTARFLAIDTPETKHPKKGEEPFGKEASSYTCNRLKTANKIELEYDGKNKTDKYDRHLVWVYVDDSLLQKELIQKGLAEVNYIYDDYRYTKELEIAESKAKVNKIGKWNDESIRKKEIFTISISIVIIILAIILFLFNKKYRKKKINMMKRKVRKKISDLF